MTSKTVLIIEDQRAFADALALAISLEPDLECVGMASTAADGLALAGENIPDVVLVDLGLPDNRGVELVVDLRAKCPDASVIVLTGRSDGRVLREVAGARADGFISKSAPLHAVMHAVRSASSGGAGVTVSSESLAVLDEGPAPDRGGADATVRLTSRELDILRLLNDGKRVADMAEALHMSVHTCRDHVKGILTKLSAHSQVEALARARQLGLLGS